MAQQLHDAPPRTWNNKGFGDCLTRTALTSLGEGNKFKKVFFCSPRSLEDVTHPANKPELHWRCKFVFIRSAYTGYQTHVAPKSKVKKISNDVEVAVAVDAFGIGVPSAWHSSDEDTQLMYLSAACVLLRKDVTELNWGEINEYIHSIVEAAEEEQSAYAYLSSVLISLCRQGQIGQNVASNIKDEMNQLRALQIDIKELVVKGYWQTLGKLFNQAEISKVMKWLLECVGGKESIRFPNLINFAKRRGLTHYFNIKDVMSRHPKFPWVLVSYKAPNDFVGYVNARHLVRDQDYYGYNPDLGNAALRHYLTLAYICWSIKVNVDQDVNFKTLKTVWGGVSMDYWNKKVEEYKNDALKFDPEVGELLKQNPHFSSILSRCYADLTPREIVTPTPDFIVRFHPRSNDDDSDDDDSHQPRPSGGAPASQSYHSERQPHRHQGDPPRDGNRKHYYESSGQEYSSKRRKTGHYLEEPSTDDSHYNIIQDQHGLRFRTLKHPHDFRAPFPSFPQSRHLTDYDPGQISDSPTDYALHSGPTIDIDELETPPVRAQPIQEMPSIQRVRRGEGPLPRPARPSGLPPKDPSKSTKPSGRPKPIEKSQTKKGTRDPAPTDLLPGKSHKDVEPMDISGKELIELSSSIVETPIDPEFLSDAGLIMPSKVRHIEYPTHEPVEIGIMTKGSESIREREIANILNHWKIPLSSYVEGQVYHFVKSVYVPTVATLPRTTKVKCGPFTIQTFKGGLDIDENILMSDNLYRIIVFKNMGYCDERTIGLLLGNKVFDAGVVSNLLRNHYEGWWFLYEHYAVSIDFIQNGTFIALPIHITTTLLKSIFEKHPEEYDKGVAMAQISEASKAHIITDSSFVVPNRMDVT